MVCLALCVIVGFCIKTILNAWQYVFECMNVLCYVCALALGICLAVRLAIRNLMFGCVEHSFCTDVD